MQYLFYITFFSVVRYHIFSYHCLNNTNLTTTLLSYYFYLFIPHEYDTLIQNNI